MAYHDHLSPNKTPQTQPLHGADQVKGKGGGYVFELDKWKILDRFLTMGSEGGSYYSDERTMTIDNATNVLECIKENGLRVVKQTYEISHSGRAPKNDPAIFVLALCVTQGDPVTKKEALNHLQYVCRIGTHLFQFVSAIQALGKWSRSLRTAVSNWYINKDLDQLAYQLVKYKQRNGMSHKDVIRLAHPKPPNVEYDNTFAWVAENPNNPAAHGSLHPIIQASDEIQNYEDNPKEAVKLIEEHRLPREVVPTKLLNNPEIWEALLPHMGLTALLRNLPKLTNVGIIKPLSSWSSEIVERLNNVEYLQKSRIHPINVLIALKTYESGHSVRGDSTWKPDGNIVDGLDSAFYAAFGNVEPTGKRLVVAVDVSGSMCWGGGVMGIPGLTPRVLSAAMAMLYVKTEPNVVLTAFSTELIETTIGKRSSLDEVCKHFSKIRMGGTNVAAPMEWAMDRAIEADGFIVLTDNETNSFGRVHPCVAIAQYRKQFNIPAKFIDIGMVANSVTVVRPDDPYSIDFSGFDSSTPQAVNSFLRI